MKHFENNNKGFTLVETMVALALFTTIIAIAIGGFVNALHAQRQVALLLATQSNVSLSLEQMARDIRTGYLFCHDASGAATCGLTPPDSCSGGGASPLICNDLDYFSATGDNVEYRLRNGSLEKGIGGNFQSVTGDNVNVKYLTFIMQGTTEGDHWNPRITVAIGVAPSTTDAGISADVLNLQTSISARLIDCSISTSTVNC